MGNPPVPRGTKPKVGREWGDLSLTVASFSGGGDHVREAFGSERQEPRVPPALWVVKRDSELVTRPWRFCRASWAPSRSSECLQMCRVRGVRREEACVEGLAGAHQLQVTQRGSPWLRATTFSVTGQYSAVSFLRGYLLGFPLGTGARGLGPWAIPDPEVRPGQ